MMCLAPNSKIFLSFVDFETTQTPFGLVVYGSLGHQTFINWEALC